MDPAAAPKIEPAPGKPQTVSPVIWITGLVAVSVILLLLFSVVMG
jgi:hypothetical protein